MAMIIGGAAVEHAKMGGTVATIADATTTTTKVVPYNVGIVGSINSGFTSFGNTGSNATGLTAGGTFNVRASLSIASSNSDLTVAKLELFENFSNTVLATHDLSVTGAALTQADLSIVRAITLPTGSTALQVRLVYKGTGMSTSSNGGEFFIAPV